MGLRCAKALAEAALLLVVPQAGDQTCMVLEGACSLPEFVWQNRGYFVSLCSISYLKMDMLCLLRNTLCLLNFPWLVRTIAPGLVPVVEVIVCR